MLDYLNHSKELENYVLSQDKGRKNLQGLLNTIVKQTQDLEEAGQDLHYNRWLATAKAVQLDKIGEFLQESRNYRSDEDYRKALYVRVMANFGNGTAEEIISILYNLFPEIAHVTYYQNEEACYSLTIYINNLINTLQNINEFVKSISPAGVKIYINYADINTVMIPSECVLAETNFLIKDDGLHFLYVDEGDTKLLIKDYKILKHKNTKGLAETILDKNMFLVDENTYREVEDNVYLEITTGQPVRVTTGGSGTEAISG